MESNKAAKMEISLESKMVVLKEILKVASTAYSMGISSVGPTVVTSDIRRAVHLGYLKVVLMAAKAVRMVALSAIK
jgi:hypothetical protein